MLNQRWRSGRESYRPAGEPIRTRDFDVAAIGSDSTAKAFILEHHYSHSYPAARFRYGLFRRGELAGVAVFSHPANDHVLTSVFPGDPLSSTELGRFVLLDDVEANAETWFLGRVFDLLRSEGLQGIVSFSDPVARFSLDGRKICPGHVGTIYQAHNGRYLGRGTPRRLRLLPDGRVLSERALSKIRRREKGWTYATALLERFGATPAPPEGDLLPWLGMWLPLLTRSVQHAGNHKYAWSLHRRRAISLPSRPYPKSLDPPLEQFALPI
jgi:hypothetical protein